MKTKKFISSIKSIISCITVAAVLVANLSGCALPWWGSEEQSISDGNVITFEETQDLVNNLLDGLEISTSQDDEEKRETVNVQSHISYGDISTTIVNSGTGDSNARFTILEISPYPQYSMLKYLVGGKEPIDCYGLDAAANSYLGINETVDAGIINQCPEILGQNNEVLDNFRYKKVYSTGYFEKVASDAREGAGGVYALQMETLPDDSTIPLLTGHFKQVDEGSGKYKTVSNNSIPDLQNTIMTAGGYKKDDHTIQYFTAADGGNYIFEPGTFEGEKFRGIFGISEYYVKYYNNKRKDNGEAEVAPTPKVSGYDFGDYEWVWHELSYSDNDGTPNSTYLMKDTTNSIPIKDFGINELKGLTTSDRIYVDKMPKYKIYNNEIFLLQCMKLGKVSANGLLKGKSWEMSLDTDNMGALTSYYGNEYETFLNENNLSQFNRVQINCVTPAEVNSNAGYINSANLIFFNCKDSDLFEKCRIMYRIEHPNCAEISSLDYAEDLSVTRMLAIYNKVINNDVTIAMDRATLESNQINIKHLGFILFNMDNDQLAFNPEDKIVYSKHDNTPYTIRNTDKVDALQKTEGSLGYNFMGRYILTDFIESLYKDKKAYSSLKDEGKVINNELPTKYLIMYEDGSLKSPALASVSTADWEQKVFSPNCDIWKQFGDYYTKLGFKMRNGKAGGTYAQYANQILYDDNTQIMDYNYSLKFLAAAMHSTNERTAVSSSETIVIGDIEVVGIGKRYGPETGTESKSYEQFVKDGEIFYSSMPYIADDGSNKKYFYLSETEYNRAGGLGRFAEYDAPPKGKGDPWGAGEPLRVYCIVKTSVPISFEEYKGDGGHADNYLITRDNPRDKSGKRYYSVLKEPRYKYASGSGENDVVVTEYAYDIHPAYFQNYINPNNDGNNVFTARIEHIMIGGREYTGEDIFTLVVRDDFDLD